MPTETATSIFVGDSETLTATITPENATNQKVTWKSSNEAVATVDAAGKVTAVKAGEATITVTTDDGGKTATCKVTVKAATVAVTGVTLNKSALHSGRERDPYGHRCPCRCHQQEGNVEVEQCGCRQR